MPLTTLTNNSKAQEQVRAIENNDEITLKIFYQNNYPKVEKYVLENGGTTDEAKDIYQEAFIAVWRAIQLKKFQPQTETSLDGYLYQVARNKWLDQLRSAKRKSIIPLTDGINNREEVPDVSEWEQLQINSIKANLLLLGEVCKDVLARFYYHKQSMRTIAAHLNWTEATARTNKYRCLERLREAIKNNKPNLE